MGGRGAGTGRAGAGGSASAAQGGEITVSGSGGYYTIRDTSGHVVIATETMTKGVYEVVGGTNANGPKLVTGYAQAIREARKRLS